MDLLGRIRMMPPGSLVPIEWVIAALEEELVSRPEMAREPMDLAADAPLSWRERLWLCPAETRIGIEELCEAVGRPKSWAYRGTSAGMLPHRKLDGALVFIAGEIRAYLRDHEESVVEGRMESASAERMLLVLPKTG